MLNHRLLLSYTHQEEKRAASHISALIDTNCCPSRERRTRAHAPSRRGYRPPHAPDPPSGSERATASSFFIHIHLSSILSSTAAHRSYHYGLCTPYAVFTAYLLTVHRVITAKSLHPPHFQGEYHEHMHQGSVVSEASHYNVQYKWIKHMRLLTSSTNTPGLLPVSASLSSV